jgi:hypothetical protein
MLKHQRWYKLRIYDKIAETDSNVKMKKENYE